MSTHVAELTMGELKTSLFYKPRYAEDKRWSSDIYIETATMKLVPDKQLHGSHHNDIIEALKPGIYGDGPIQDGTGFSYEWGEFIECMEDDKFIFTTIRVYDRDGNYAEIGLYPHTIYDHKYDVDKSTLMSFYYDSETLVHSFYKKGLLTIHWDINNVKRDRD